VGITFWSIVFFPTGRLNLGFITEGKLAAIFIKPYLGVSNWPVIYFIYYTPTSFLAPSSPRHQAPLLHRQKLGHLSTHYIFITSYTMRFS
jgi:hypothetical protein